MNYQEYINKYEEGGGFLKGAARFGGYFIPGVGTALSAQDAWRDFKKGKILSGLLNSAFAITSLVPGLGAASGALKGLGAGLKGVQAAKKMGAATKLFNSIGRKLPKDMKLGKSLSNAGKSMRLWIPGVEASKIYKGANKILHPFAGQTTWGKVGNVVVPLGSFIGANKIENKFLNPQKDLSPEELLEILRQNYLDYINAVAKSGSYMIP